MCSRSERFCGVALNGLNLRGQRQVQSIQMGVLALQADDPYLVSLIVTLVQVTRTLDAHKYETTNYKAEQQLKAYEALEAPIEPCKTSQCTSRRAKLGAADALRVFTQALAKPPVDVIIRNTSTTRSTNIKGPLNPEPSTLNRSIEQHRHLRSAGADHVILSLWLTPTVTPTPTRAPTPAPPA